MSSENPVVHFPSRSSKDAPSDAGGGVQFRGPVTVTVREFCELVKISRSAFYEARKKGLIKVHKLGKKTLIRASEVEAFLLRIAVE